MSSFYIKQITETYLKSVIQIFLSNNCPANIYLTDYNNVEQFLQDTTEKLKGFFIVESQKYYNGELIKRINNTVNNVGVFITVDLGKFDFSNLPDFNTTVVYNFDFNSDIDPFGMITMNLIDWFIEKHYEEVKTINVEGCRFISIFKYLSEPIYKTNVGVINFIRRSLVFSLKTIICKY